MIDFLCLNINSGGQVIQSNQELLTEIHDCLFITDNSEMAVNHMVGLYYDHVQILKVLALTNTVY